MLLSAILTKDDLVSILEQLTPLTVTLRRGRVISFGRSSTMELVAGAGLRIRGDARFTWDAGGLTIPVILRAWQVLLVPSLVARGGGHLLAFDPELEALDFKSVPVFLDARIKAAINDGLAAQRNRLLWNFEKHLSYVWPLPASVAPKGELRSVRTEVMWRCPSGRSGSRWTSTFASAAKASPRVSRRVSRPSDVISQ